MRPLLALSVLVVLAGCGSSEASAPESAASTAQGQAAASTWSPEMKEKFKAAHADARSGADDKPAAYGK